MGTQMWFAGGQEDRGGGVLVEEPGSALYSLHRTPHGLGKALISRLGTGSTNDELFQRHTPVSVAENSQPKLEMLLKLLQNTVSTVCMLPVPSSAESRKPL